jgi:hypothetical protein
MASVEDLDLSWMGHVASVGAIFTTILGWAPPIAAMIAVIWYLIQISESQTAIQWRANRAVLNHARKVARAKVAAAEAQAKTLVDAAKADAKSVLRAAATGAHELVEIAKEDAATVVATDKAIAATLVASKQPSTPLG